MSGDPRLIFVIDDDESILDILKLTLESEGYRVLTAGNGQEGLAELRESPRPFVILLDLMMPLVDGWGFLREQKLDPAIADIPVIAMSAHVERFASVAAHEFLHKPIELQKLLALVVKYDPARASKIP